MLPTLHSFVIPHVFPLIIFAFANPSFSHTLLSKHPCISPSRRVVVIRCDLCFSWTLSLYAYALRSPARLVQYWCALVVAQLSFGKSRNLKAAPSSHRVRSECAPCASSKTTIYPQNVNMANSRDPLVPCMSRNDIVCATVQRRSAGTDHRIPLRDAVSVTFGQTIRQYDRRVPRPRSIVGSLSSSWPSHDRRAV